MTVTIRIRNVPERLRRKLEARAAVAGMSLTDFVLAELRRSLDRPTREEWLDRLASRSSVEIGDAGLDALRADRDAR